MNFLNAPWRYYARERRRYVNELYHENQLFFRRSIAAYIKIVCVVQIFFLIHFRNVKTLDLIDLLFCDKHLNFASNETIFITQNFRIVNIRVLKPFSTWLIMFLVKMVAVHVARKRLSFIKEKQTEIKLISICTHWLCYHNNTAKIIIILGWGEAVKMQHLL